MLSIKDGEQDEVLFVLATLIAQYSNPFMFFDLAQLSEDEIQSDLESLKSKMKEIIG